MSETKTTKCPLPLYHGTSTLFVDSIKEFGLGGKDIIQEGKVLEFARKIFPLVKDNLPENDGSRHEVSTFKNMVDQHQLYQHGQVYLSLSYDYCTRFAQAREFGSELFSHSLYYYGKLLEKKLVSPDLLNDYPYLKEVKRVGSKPVVIKVKDIDWDNLLTVDGNALPTENIEKILEISEWAESHIKEVAKGSHRFRLINPIPSDKIEFDFNPSAKYPEDF